MDVLLWIVAGLILAVGEVFTVSFVLIPFALGAFAAAAAAGLGAPFLAQGVVFMLLSLAALFGIRPTLRRYLAPTAGDSPAVGEITGHEAIVLEQVDADRGMVKIDGETWQARALDAQILEPGERVHVVEIKGATVVVWRI
jgi:membrane protein implicated in regulation of membrane protease activity